MPTPKVEANIGGTWVDVTADDLDPSFLPVRRRVRTGSGVTISRGRGDWNQLVSAGTCVFEVNNQDGKYSGRNPNSPYYGLLGRNTPVRVGVDPMSDTFTRTVVDGWGTSSSGHAWAVGAGSATNFDVNGTAATLTGNTQVGVLPNSYGQVDVLVKFRLSSLTGQPRVGIVTHWRSSQNHFQIVYDNLFGGLALIRASNSSGSPGQDTLDIGAFSVTAGVDYWIRGRVNAAVVQGRIWQDGNTEPGTWTAESRPDAAQTNAGPLLKGGKVGLLLDFGGSTTATFDSLEVVSYRFHGEVRSWPPRWDKAGVDVSMPIEAVGVLNRLGSSGQATLASAMYREATKASVVQYTAAYWPCEDGSDATTFASAVPGVESLVMLDGGSFGQTSTIPGSKAMGVLASGASLHGVVPGIVDTTGKVFFRIVLDVPASPTTPDATNIFNIYCSGSSAARFGLNYLTASGGALDLVAVAANQSVLESASLGGGLNGKRLYLSIELVQSGGNIAVTTARNEIAADNLSTASFVATDTWVGLTVGKMFAWSAGTMEGWGFCHVGVGNDQQFMFGMREALIGNAGETAGNRMIRVAAEAQIPLQIIGDPDQTALMGPQVPGSALDVLQSCAEADQGVLFESRNEFGLSYRTLASMYTQAGPVLDYDGGHVNSIEPVEDDQFLYNDVTVSRVNGSSARAVLESGPLSVQEPPDGAGRIEAPALTLAVGSDVQLPNIASWRLHNFTWDEQRFRTLGVQHGAPALTADPDLWAQLAALDSGDLLAADNPPPWLPPDQIRQLVQGYSEVIAEDGVTSLWQIDWNTAPAGPYNIGVWDDAGSRYDTDLSTLASGASAGASSLSVASPAIGLWTIDANNLPLDIMIAGERITVTEVFGPPLNFLGANNSTFEASIGSWTGAGNANVAQTSAQAHGGTQSMSITAIAAGAATAAHCTAGNILTSGLACASGDTIVVAAWLRADTTGRSVQVGAQFYDAGGVSLGVPTYGSTVTDTTTGWVKPTATVTAPASSARCRMVVNVLSAGGAGEVHYVDDAGIGNATTGSTTQQTMIGNRSVNGVVKALPSGAKVSLADPVYWGL